LGQPRRAWTVWTSLTPATMPSEKLEQFGTDTRLGRQGQPAAPVPVYVPLASDQARYVSLALHRRRSRGPILWPRSRDASASWRRGQGLTSDSRTMTCA
jgi:hypothetical protein